MRKMSGLLRRDPVTMAARSPPTSAPPRLGARSAAAQAPWPGLELILLLLAISAGLRIRCRACWPSPTHRCSSSAAFCSPSAPACRASSRAPRMSSSSVFVPPLLYLGRGLVPAPRFLAGYIGRSSRLAVLMVLASTAAVAAIAHAIDPAFTRAAGSPPSARSCSPPSTRSRRFPSSPQPQGCQHRIQSILEGEGLLLNHATALVAYRVAAVASSHRDVLSSGAPHGHFLAAATGGLLIGVAVGGIVLGVHRLTRTVPVVENTISLLTPYAAWLPAELAGASGVVSVCAAGMVVARYVQDAGRPETRIQNTAMWSVVTFRPRALAFILVGLECRRTSRGRCLRLRPGRC